VLCTLVALTGCYGYRDIVDPCYPWRYNWTASQEVCEGLGNQVNNGHVLDQTVWPSDFERGTATLTGGGIDHLNTMLRRRPHPDPIIYLATATLGGSPNSDDVIYSPALGTDTLVQRREKLNQDRIEAIQKYLAVQTAGRNLNFQVYLHDPAQPYMNAPAMQKAYSRITAGGGGGGGGQ